MDMNEEDQRNLFRGALVQQQQQEPQRDNANQVALRDEDIARIAMVVTNAMNNSPKLNDIFDQSVAAGAELSLVAETQTQVVNDLADVKDTAKEILTTTRDIKSAVNDMKNATRNVMTKCTNPKSLEDINECLIEITKAFLTIIGKMLYLFYSLVLFMHYGIHSTTSGIPVLGGAVALFFQTLLWGVIIFFIVIALTIIPGVSVKAVINISAMLLKALRDVGFKLVTNLQDKVNESEGVVGFYAEIFDKSGLKNDTLAATDYLSNTVNNYFTNTTSTVLNDKVDKALQNVTTVATENIVNGVTASISSRLPWPFNGGGTDSEEIDEEIDTSKMIAEEDNEAVQSTELVNGIVIAGNLIG